MRANEDAPTPTSDALPASVVVAPRVGVFDHVLGAAMGAAFVVWLLSGARALGFCRDEGFYFQASTAYANWFELLLRAPSEGLTQSAIDSAWAHNHEHPSLVKSLFALSYLFLHKRWGFIADASGAFRLPGMVFAGVAMWVTYVFGARVFSRRAGIVAAWALMLAPNVFYHAHLACFDIAIVAMWTLCIYVYWRAVACGGWRWAVGAGVAYGLTLETKHNAWVLPAVFVAHWTYLALRRALVKAGGHSEGSVRRLWAPLLAMATLGPAIFVGLWPWLWHDTIPRIGGYIGFHVHHDYYNIEFLHRNYDGPPNSPLYAPVMTLATVPSITILLFLIGVVARGKIRLGELFFPKRFALAQGADPAPLRDRRFAPDVLFVLGFGAAMGPFFLPSTPIFGGTKHWMTAYPFLALFAGHGFDRTCIALRELAARWIPSMAPAHHGSRGSAARGWAPAAIDAALAICVFAAPVAVTSHSHTAGLSAYVPFFGGTAGGADLGLNRQFWGFTTQNVAPYLDAHAPPNATLYFHDTAWQSWERMQAEGRIRRDLRGVGSPSDAMYSLTHLELHMATQDVLNWIAAGTAAPEYVYVHDGVPLVPVYRKRSP
jgi:4-amino-4-deoxy-L-arabinose transferase-like glycosyltransferase